MSIPNSPTIIQWWLCMPESPHLCTLRKTRMFVMNVSITSYTLRHTSVIAKVMLMWKWKVMIFCWNELCIFHEIAKIIWICFLGWSRSTSTFKHFLKASSDSFLHSYKMCEVMRAQKKCWLRKYVNVSFEYWLNAFLFRCLSNILN